MATFDIQPLAVEPDVALKPLRRVLFGTIRNKIILPFLLVTLTVAVLGTYVVTRLVASSAQDRLTNQLLELSRATNDSIVNWEQRHLDTLRLTTFTVGIAEALRDSDEAELSLALKAIALNQNAHLLMVVDQDGIVLADAMRISTGYETGQMRGTNIGALRTVGQVLNASIDATGDKFTEIGELNETRYFLTSAPVIDDNGELVGAVIIGTPVAEMLADIKHNVLADLVVYQADGKAVSTTFVLTGEAELTALNIDPGLYESALANPDRATLIGEMAINQRNYQVAYTPLQIRDETIGLIGVAYPTTLITSLITTNRSGMIVLFSVITVLVVLLGFGIAANLSAPIRKLAQTAEKVRAGKLDEQSDVRTSDEIGVLGRVFDDMMLRLSQQTVTLKRLYKEQEREAAYLGAVIASSADGTFVLENDKSISRLNPVASEIMKHNEGAWHAILSDLIDELQLGESAKRRVEISDAWYDAIAAPIHTSRGDTAGYIITAHDVTDQVLTDQMRTSFILQMSHELYTPLTTLKGCTEAAYSTLENKDSISGQFLMPAIENAKTLEQMIGQMLDVAQMIRGGFSIERAPVDLAPIIEAVISEHEVLAKSHEVKLVWQLDKDLLASGDAERLRWAAEHMIRNAIQYSTPGTEVTISMTQQEQVIQFCVHDSGVGIGASDMPHLFEPFYRGCPMNKYGSMIDVRGTGLGLFIVKKVVDAHDGTLVVQSEPGLGSEFAIRLPVVGGGTSAEAEELWHDYESNG